MANRDDKAFGATIDQDRRALVRCANESYDIAGRQGVVGPVHQPMPVIGRVQKEQGARHVGRMGLGRQDALEEVVVVVGNEQVPACVAAVVVVAAAVNRHRRLAPPVGAGNHPGERSTNANTEDAEPLRVDARVPRQQCQGPPRHERPVIPR